MRPLQWLADRDRDFVALRRAARTAIVMPAMFALGGKVIGDAEIATFAAFGSFAMLMLVDFRGPVRERVQAQAALGLTGAVLVFLGTLASRNIWLAAVAMTLVGFAVIFAGVVSSVLAAATSSLLLAFILPVMLAAPFSVVPARLAGWGMAAVAAVVAVAVLWPAPTREPLRAAAGSACRALAGRLRSEVVHVLSDHDPTLVPDRDRAVEAADQAVGAVHRVFLATPYRPTGLSTTDRAIVRLVDELSWLSAIVGQSAQPAGSAQPARSAQPAAGSTVNRTVCDVKLAACTVLERAADLLEVTGGDTDDLHAAMTALNEALIRAEQAATDDLPVGRQARPPEPGVLDRRVDELITSLDPGFRAQELSFAVSLIAGNVDLAAAAERRGWLDRLLGRRPEGLSGALSAAQERVTAHVERHSVWMHNSLRGAVGLGLAVLVANLSGVQHSFWVVLGTLSLLRSNALNTGQNALRGLFGTVAGFVIGATLLVALGMNATLLWIVLPIAILVAGVAPSAISFAAGQAAFTLTLVILFNIIQPIGWRIGLIRVEDIALGCAVSLLVGLLFWPRGAGAALRRAVAEAYTDSARYLAGAVEFGVSRCDPTNPSRSAPRVEATRAAAAARRLDDAFREYLAERGAKPLPLSQVTGLVTGVAGIRLAADAVIDLWQRDDGSAAGDREAARRELLTSADLVQTWFVELAGSLVDRQEPPEPLPHDRIADGRLLEAVRQDLRGDDGRATATAVRMIWTGDHLDAVRRLQPAVVGPARNAAAARTLGVRDRGSG